MTEGKAGKTNQRRLRVTKLFSFGKCKLKSDIVERFKILRELTGLNTDNVLYPIKRRTTGVSMKLEGSRSRLEVMANFCHGS